MMKNQYESGRSGPSQGMIVFRASHRQTIKKSMSEKMAESGGYRKQESIREGPEMSLAITAECWGYSKI